MTIDDYNLTTNTVRIADLKARLSEYLRRGHAVTVLDRDTPTAPIVPYDPAAADVRIRRPRPGAGKPSAVRLPPPLKLDVDVVALLMEERQPDR